MEYLWDPAKGKANYLKHGVEFSEAVISLEDPYSLHIVDPECFDEERFIALGIDSLGRILVTVYSYHEDTVRIISSRKASPRERKHYQTSS